MLEVLETLESSSDTTVYALDETGISVESSNYLSWSPIGHPPILEKNASHTGVNVVGSTTILSNYHSVNDVYPSQHSITSEEIKTHIEHLLQINEGKKVVIFMDNAKTHTSRKMEKFYLDNRDRLTIIPLPRYSPSMNPQENVWSFVKSKLFKPSARSSIYELINDIKMIFDELNSDVEQLRSLAYARSFLV